MTEYFEDRIIIKINTNDYVNSLIIDKRKFVKNNQYTFKVNDKIVHLCKQDLDSKAK
jgi:hypothetical protein